jgi:hypothetical protein
MKSLKCILVILLVVTFILSFLKKVEHFQNTRNSVKAGAIQMYHDPDDYDYRLLGIKTIERCARKDKNLSKALKHHNPDPTKAGSIQYNKQRFTDGIPIENTLSSIDKDDFVTFPKFKYKKRKFPPVEKTDYYPYESILKPKTKEIKEEIK